MKELLKITYTNGNQEIYIWTGKRFKIIKDENRRSNKRNTSIHQS